MKKNNTLSIRFKNDDERKILIDAVEKLNELEPMTSVNLSSFIKHAALYHAKKVLNKK